MKLDISIFKTRLVYIHTYVYNAIYSHYSALTFRSNRIKSSLTLTLFQDHRKSSVLYSLLIRHSEYVTCMQTPIANADLVVVI